MYMDPDNINIKNEISSVIDITFFMTNWKLDKNVAELVDVKYSVNSLNINKEKTISIINKDKLTNKKIIKNDMEKIELQTLSIILE